MNPKVHVLRLDLPGLWTDGWLYKEHLILWSRTGQMYFCPLSSIVDSVKGRVSHELGVIAEFLIFRSDWKRSAQFKRMVSLPGIEERFLAGFEREMTEAVISVDDVALEPVAVDPVPGVMLDSGIYNNCVFTGTTAGLFETRFDADSPAVGSKPLVTRLEKRVSALTARYSAVNASAGKEGLWFSRMNFDDGTWWRDKGNPRRVAEFSRGNSFVEHDLLNYTNDPFPGFMRSEGETEKSPANRESDTWRITGYDIPSDIGGLMKSALGLDQGRLLFAEDFDEDPGKVEVIGNAGKRLLVAFGSSLRVVNLSVSKKAARDIQAKASTSFQRFSDPAVDPSDILSTHGVEDGFLVELPDEVRLINPHGSFSLIDEPVAQIRTFGHARRYPDVILMIRENCVSLLGVYLTQATDPA